MVWRLLHFGQDIGVEYAVACHSMSRASKTWPQSSHLNFFFPLIIVVNVSKLDMLCKDRLFIINVQGKRKKNIVLSFKFNICRNYSLCVWVHMIRMVYLLEQTYYRHCKQGEEDYHYGTKGDDYPFCNLNDGGEGGVGSFHIALDKIQSA